MWTSPCPCVTVFHGKCGPVIVPVCCFMGNVDQSLFLFAVLWEMWTSHCSCGAVLWEMWTSHCSCVLFYGKCGPVIVPVCCFMGNVDQSLSLWCCFPWEMWTRQTSLNHWDRQTTCRFSCTSKALTVTNTECCISFVFVLYSLLVILSEKRTELCTDVGYCIYLCDDRKVSDCEHDCWIETGCLRDAVPHCQCAPGSPLRSVRLQGEGTARIQYSQEGQSFLEKPAGAFACLCFHM